jgi:hypothetical protein
MFLLRQAFGIHVSAMKWCRRRMGRLAVSVSQSCGAVQDPKFEVLLYPPELKTGNLIYPYFDPIP